ncbi:TetR/AcrR family transcriptional regulator [Cognatishimia sp. WU-CL00825]|uniref:TetR/AcrR family transcriptional regulator n=1 Tax=Cognatishimia sp. WU-CL00825 TaxID=3127658 RepID=UPI0031086992
MKRPTKEAIAERIIKAVTTTVATQGIGSANMATVAKTAQISAGTLYLHYESKEDMLQQVYLHIKRDFHAKLMAPTRGVSAKQAVSGMWHALLTFQHQDPHAFLFLETTGAAQVLTQTQKTEIAPMQTEVESVIRSAIDQNVISPPSLGVAINILIGPALHLARKHALAGTRIPQDEADQTFDMVWRSLGGL